MSAHHCWKWCRLKAILKFYFNDFSFQLWDKVIWSSSGQVTGTEPCPSKLVLLCLGDANKALGVDLLDSLMGLADMLSTSSHVERVQESRKGSAVMCSSLVVLLWLKGPSPHKLLPLPVWSLLILGLEKVWNLLSAWCRSQWCCMFKVFLLALQVIFQNFRVSFKSLWEELNEK